MKKIKYISRTPVKDRLCDSFKEAVEHVERDCGLSMMSRQVVATLIEKREPLPTTGSFRERTLTLYGKNDRKAMIFAMELP